MRAAAMIIAVWMPPEASGWRAMLSTALEAILPMPNAEPIHTKPAPIAPELIVSPLAAIAGVATRAKTNASPRMRMTLFTCGISFSYGNADVTRSLPDHQWWWTAEPMNSADKNVNTYAWRNATNS